MELVTTFKQTFPNRILGQDPVGVFLLLVHLLTTMTLFVKIVRYDNAKGGHFVGRHQNHIGYPPGAPFTNTD